MNNKKEKIIIIDGNALIHRSFHALPPTLRTKDGILVNAVYGFSSFLLKALNEFKPSHVVLTLDKSGPTFRHLEYSDYKATRTKAPDELYEQIPIIKEVAKAFDIPIFELSGFEADDLIGTICHLEEIKNLEKIIITGDLDTLQLVNEKTKVYTMSRGLSDSILYDEEKIKERYGFGANKIIDYKALRGDPSDNIPGVKGIGEKTATELLINFENLEGIYQEVEKENSKIKGRTLELLKNDKEKAYLSRKLATINNQVPIKFQKSQAVFNSFDTQNVFKLFSKLDFSSLLIKVKNLKEVLTNINPDANKTKKANKKTTIYQDIETETEIKSLIQKISQTKIISIKTINSLDNNQNQIIGITLSIKENEVFFINKNQLQGLKEILEDENIKKIGHDLKEDYLLLKNEIINLKGLYFDLMIASYLLNPSSRNHEFSALAFKELGLNEEIENEEIEKKNNQLKLALEDNYLESIRKKSCYEVNLAWELKKVLEKKLINSSLFNVFETIEMPLIEVLGEMEYCGIYFSKNPIKTLANKLNLKINRLENEIHELAGENFNINSTKQLKEILFEKLNITTSGIKKNKTGFSTADDELEKLINAHPIIAKLREYREINKLITTYINPLPEIVNKSTGRIHSHFNQAITATGRLSSSDPNLQNIPTRTEEGKIIRQSFTVKKDWLMLGLDYSQIELRLAAHLSNDKKMLQAFLSGKDVHLATAAEINEININEVTKKMRHEAKATNFGIIYGQGPHGLSQAAGIPYHQAKEFIKKYFISYPGIKKMMNQSIKNAQEKGYAITISGRKRPLPEINSSIPMIKKGAERMAINTPVQGSAADIIKLAMIKIYNLIKSDSENIHLLLQVHDELIFEIKKNKVDYYLPKIKEIMESIIKLKVPLKVESAIADNWGDLK